jgi:hypothetical protein
MVKAEKKLASIFLNRAAAEFNNHGCNDFMEEDYEGLSKEDVKQITASINEWDGHKDPEDDMRVYHVPDWLLMRYLADILEDES